MNIEQLVVQCLLAYNLDDSSEYENYVEKFSELVEALGSPEYTEKYDGIEVLIYLLQEHYKK